MMTRAPRRSLVFSRFPLFSLLLSPFSSVLPKAPFVLCCLALVWGCSSAPEDVLARVETGLAEGSEPGVTAGFTSESQGLLTLLGFADGRFALGARRAAPGARQWTLAALHGDQGTEQGIQQRVASRGLTTEGWGGVVPFRREEGAWKIDLVAMERSLRRRLEPRGQ